MGIIIHINELTVRINKAKCMIISKRKVMQQFQFQIQSSKLRCPPFNSIGFILNSRLNFDYQINSVKYECKLSINEEINLNFTSSNPGVSNIPRGPARPAR